jgi:hypothetical protein
MRAREADGTMTTRPGPGGGRPDPSLDAIMSERRQLINLAYRLLGSLAGQGVLFGGERLGDSGGKLSGRCPVMIGDLLGDGGCGGHGDTSG